MSFSDKCHKIFKGVGDMTPIPTQYLNSAQNIRITNRTSNMLEFYTYVHIYIPTIQEFKCNNLITLGTYGWFLTILGAHFELLQWILRIHFTHANSCGWFRVYCLNVNEILSYCCGTWFWFCGLTHVARYWLKSEIMLCHEFWRYFLSALVDSV